MLLSRRRPPGIGSYSLGDVVAIDARQLECLLCVDVFRTQECQFSELSAVVFTKQAASSTVLLTFSQ
jgi:hypothetical protein